MPPTIQTNLNADRDKRPPRPGEKRSELVCRVKYCNTLPDIPFDPKFITYPFESRRFIEYNPTSLERNYKYEVLTEHDLGVTIDLINKDLYTPDFRQMLDPADEKLLEEDILTQQDSKRSRHHGTSVSWLRRTEYISTEQTRFQPQTMDKVEAKVGYSIKKNFKDETLYMDRESQVRAIEKTFTDSKQPIEKHYSKPNIVPVEVLPVFPDFKLWKYPCAQVIFDSDPAPVGRPVPAQIEEMSQAMIRGVMDESGEQFVAYFLPTETTLEKRKADFVNNIEYTEDEEYEYKMAREYNWNVKSKASKGYEENYYLVMRPDGVYYNELETRVRLSKRRQKAGQQVNNTRLVVCHRTLNASEYKMQRYREKQLEPANEDEEEEEEEEEEETVQDQTNDDNKSDDEDKANSEKGRKSHSGSEKEDSDKEGSQRNKDADKEEEDSDKEKDDSDKDKEDSDKDKDDSDKDKEDSVKGRNESDKDKEDSENERGESDVDGHESDQEVGAPKKKNGNESDDAQSASSSDSSSASENEAENKVEKTGEKSDAVSQSSGSRSSSRSHSPSRSPSPHRSRSRSQSAQPSRSPSPRSGSASGSGSE